MKGRATAYSERERSLKISGFSADKNSAADSDIGGGLGSNRPDVINCKWFVLNMLAVRRKYKLDYYIHRHQRLYYGRPA